MDLKTIHGFLSNAVTIFTALVTLFALLRFFQKQALGGDFWGTVVIGEGLIVVQGLLGIIMLIQGLFPGQWVHILYGAVAMLTWPAAYAYTRNQSQERETLIWLLVSAFLFGISLRARATAFPV